MENDSKFIVEWHLCSIFGRKSKESGTISFDDDLNDYVAEGVEGNGSIQRNCN